MFLHLAVTTGLRLFFGFASAALLTLAIAVASSYLGGGWAPATLLYLFFCICCEALWLVAALIAAVLFGAFIAATVHARFGGRDRDLRNGSAERRAASLSQTVKSQC